MIGIRNCLITSVRLPPTVRLDCPLTILQNNDLLVQSTAVYAQITFEGIVMIVIRYKTKESDGS